MTDRFPAAYGNQHPNLGYIKPLLRDCFVHSISAWRNQSRDNERLCVLWIVGTGLVCGRQDTASGKTTCKLPSWPTNDTNSREYSSGMGYPAAYEKWRLIGVLDAYS